MLLRSLPFGSTTLQSLGMLSALSALLMALHRSFGVTVWVVTLRRLVWHQFSRLPNWPADMPQAMRFAAQWSEYALYALLLTQLIPGLLQTNAHGDRVNLFFLGQLPALIGQDRPLVKQLLEVHERVGLSALPSRARRWPQSRPRLAAIPLPGEPPRPMVASITWSFGSTG